MVDSVQGIAVLDEDVSPQMLYIICVPLTKEDKAPFMLHIAVRESHQPPAERTWTYDRRGLFLHVQPSVLVRNRWPEDPPDSWREIFHNSASWNVEYVRADTKESGRSDRTAACYRQLRRLNQSLLKDEVLDPPEAEEAQDLQK